VVSRAITLGGHFKTGHRGSLQNRPTEHHPGRTCFTLPDGCLATPIWSSPAVIIRPSVWHLAEPDSSLILLSPGAELGKLNHSFLLCGRHSRPPGESHPPTCVPRHRRRMPLRFRRQPAAWRRSLRPAPIAALDGPFRSPNACCISELASDGCPATRCGCTKDPFCNADFATWPYYALLVEVPPHSHAPEKGSRMAASSSGGQLTPPACPNPHSSADAPSAPSRPDCASAAPDASPDIAGL
jgi:hypothetical protein